MAQTQSPRRVDQGWSRSWQSALQEGVWVLSPLVEGEAGLVEACEMIKKDNEEKQYFWMEWDITEWQSTGGDWMNGMQWVEGGQGEEERLHQKGEGANDLA